MAKGNNARSKDKKKPKANAKKGIASGPKKPTAPKK